MEADGHEGRSRVITIAAPLLSREQDVVQRDRRTFAHAAEDAVGPVEELLWGVELLKETSAMYSGALENDRSTDRYISRVENEDAIVRNDRAQTVCATVRTR